MKKLNFREAATTYSKLYRKLDWEPGQVRWSLTHPLESDDLTKMEDLLQRGDDSHGSSQEADHRV